MLLLFSYFPHCTTLSNCFAHCVTAFRLSYCFPSIQIVLLLDRLCYSFFQLCYYFPCVLSLCLYALQVAKFPKSSWTEELGETTQASLETFIESVHANTSGRTILLALLGPSSAGPGDDDGWFAADFVMAHHIYGDIGGEQTWLSSVDLAKEAEAGPYLWGYPKEMRTVVFTKDDNAFYTLCDSQDLIATYKDKLQSVVASMSGDDRLLLLIFAHGEEKGTSGILVGADSQGGFGILTVEEVNTILRPLVGFHSVTLITSACYSGEWHHDTRTTFAATGEDEESLSFPVSASGCSRGGYFWSGIWYELSRLGVPMVGNDIPEEETFQSWTERVQRRVQELMIFNPIPTVSVEYEAIFKKHAREVICLQLEMAGFSFTSSLQTVPSNPHPDSVRDDHFTGGGGSSSSSGTNSWIYLYIKHQLL